MLQGPKTTIRRARKLRREMSLPEVLLWRILRQRPDDLKFRHQHPAGPFSADFFCHKAKLVIEIDGAAHGMGNRPQRDAARDAWFAERDFDVMRIAAGDVLKDVNAVAEGIIARANSNLKSSPARGGRPRSSGRVPAPEAGSASTVAPLHHLPSAGGPPPLDGEDLRRAAR